MNLTTSIDEETKHFLALKPQEQFASIVADLVKQYGLKSELPVTETLADGLYIREVFIPKGSVIVGALHKLPSANICAQGRISILGSDGSRHEISAPFSAIGQSGAAKIGFAIEDTRWINVFHVKSESLETVRAEIAYSDFETLKLIDPESKFIGKELLCQ